MKLLGKTADGWILSASDDEVANVAGYVSEYQAREKIRPTVGTNINVAKMYEEASQTLGAYSELRDQFTKASKQLERLLGLIGPKPEKEKKA